MGVEEFSFTTSSVIANHVNLFSKIKFAHGVNFVLFIEFTFNRPQDMNFSAVRLFDVFGKVSQPELTGELSSRQRCVHVHSGLGALPILLKYWRAPHSHACVMWWSSTTSPAEEASMRSLIPTLLPREKCGRRSTVEPRRSRPCTGEPVSAEDRLISGSRN